MANNFKHSLILLFAFCLMLFISVEGYSLTKAENAEQNIEIRENWQILEWSDDSSDAVLYYEVIIQLFNPHTKKYEKARTIVTEDNNPSIKIRPRLKEGQYRYKIVSYNLIEVPVSESDWSSFTIYKSQVPEVASITTDTTHSATLFLEDINTEKITLNVTGVDLFPPPQNDSDISKEGAYTTYKFIGQKGTTIIPDVLETDKNGHNIKIQIDVENLETDKYQLFCLSASGLSNEGDLGAALTVKFKKSFDLDLSIGYAPTLTLHDMMFFEYTGSQIWPGGANIRLSFLPMKDFNNYFGFGINAAYTRISSKQPSYVLVGNLWTAHINFVYQKPFRTKTKRQLVTLDCHAGIGCVYFDNLQFEYTVGGASKTLSSLSFSFDIGIAAQIYMTRRFYGEICLDYFIAPFFINLVYGALIPSISIGWQF